MTFFTTDVSHALSSTQLSFLNHSTLLFVIWSPQTQIISSYIFNIFKLKYFFNLFFFKLQQRKQLKYVSFWLKINKQHSSKQNTSHRLLHMIKNTFLDTFLTIEEQIDLLILTFLVIKWKRLNLYFLNFIYLFIYYIIILFVRSTKSQPTTLPFKTQQIPTKYIN